MAVAHAIIWSGVRIEMAPTCVESRLFEVLGGILRVLVYCRDPLDRPAPGFYLKCRVTPRVLSRCDSGLGLLVAPEYFVRSIVG